MSDRDPVWDALKVRCKEKFSADRKTLMEKAIADDDGGWVKHTQYHWSRYVRDERLDYWPSRAKFQYQGKIRRGDVYEFIRRKV